MNNDQRVYEAASLIGMADKVFKTYGEWRKAGYQVQRGEKAMLKVDLWIPAKRKDEDEKQRFFLKTSYLFSEDQVKENVKKSA